MRIIALVLALMALVHWVWDGWRSVMALVVHLEEDFVESNLWLVGATMLLQGVIWMFMDLSLPQGELLRTGARNSVHRELSSTASSHVHCQEEEPHLEYVFVIMSNSPIRCSQIQYK